MITLTSTDKIQALSTSGVLVLGVVAYSDRSASSGSLPATFPAVLNGATPVDIVGSPGVGMSRTVEYITLYNADVINQNVTIRYNANGTLLPLFVCTLAPGEKVEYNKVDGFKAFSNAGSIKNIVIQGNNPISSLLSSAVLGLDVTNSNAVANTMADVTGLSFPVANNGKYYFKFIIQYTAAATTTGSRWGINAPTGTIRITSRYSLTTTTETLNYGVAATDNPAASNASSAATNSNIAIIEGFFESNANGNVIARFASEVAGSAIVAKAGSVVYYQQVQ